MTEITFPSLRLDEWRETRDTLHKYCRMVMAIRENLCPSQSRGWHKGLGINTLGLTTNLILKNIATPQQTFEVILDLAKQRLVIESNFWDAMRIHLSGQSLNALCDETCSLLAELGITPPMKSPMLIDGKRGRFDPEFVLHYWEAVKSSYKILSGFRGELTGIKSPVQLWHEHFNLSFFWYPGNISSGSEIAKEQIEFGFSTGDEFIPDTYLFVKPQQTPEETYSVSSIDTIGSKVMSGLVLLYKDLLSTINPAEKLLNFFRAFKYSYA